MKKENTNSQKIIIAIIVYLAAFILSGCLKPDVGTAPQTVMQEPSPTPPTPEPAPEPEPPSPPPQQPQPPAKITTYAADIKDIAAKSSCAQVSWADRGRAPVGYIKGMALSYARSLCRIKATPTEPAAGILKSASSGNARKDVLAHYSDILTSAGLRINVAGDEPLHATYTIGMGLGMRESSGRYCEGWDTAAGSDRTSAEAEAGLFQASYNSMSASTELRKLYDEYKADENRCLLNTFKENVSCKAQSILGTGPGADYQVFVKKCPAFATEYTMTLIRILRAHFGPLNRRTAQVIPACDSMLKQVQQLVERDVESACAELF